MTHISDIKLIVTYTILDLSQKGRKMYDTFYILPFTFYADVGQLIN